MKILFVFTPAFNPMHGGVQRLVEKVGRYFSQEGHEVLYYSTANEGHVEPAHGSLSFSSGSGGADNPRNLRELHEFVLQAKPDVVLNEMPYEEDLSKSLRNAKQEHDYLLLGCLNNSLFSVKNNLREYGRKVLPAPVAFLAGAKWVQGLLLNMHKKRHAAQLKKILDTHDLFVMQSEANGRELRYFVGDHGEGKTDWVPNSIPPVAEVETSRKEKTLLYVGRLERTQKRSDLLSEIWARVCEELPDWQLEIVGEGPYREEMERKMNRQGLPRVTFRGFQDPAPFYERAVIFLMPSAYEGFPSVLLEAQSHRVVPVTFNSYPALTEIVNHNEDAIACPAFDVDSFARETVALAKDPERRKSMADAGRRNAARFTTDKIGKRWLDLFKQYTNG